MQFLNIISILVTWDVSKLLRYIFSTEEQLVNIEFISSTKEVLNDDKFNSGNVLQSVNIYFISFTFSVLKFSMDKLFNALHE